METIFAPWRMEYIKSEKTEGCVFCKCSVRCDDYVLYEGKYTLCDDEQISLRKRSFDDYSPAAYRQIFEDLSQEERKEIFNLLETSVKALREAMNPDGFNIGMNIGKAAGAGIEEHIHLHVIPRWEGDTNFMSVVGNVRVIPEDVATTAANLAPLFKKYHQEV